MDGRRDRIVASALVTIVSALMATPALGAEPVEGEGTATSASGEPSGLSAYALLEGLDAAAVLGKPFAAVEDLGVFPSGCATGYARALTARGSIVEVDLQTLPSSEEALAQYESSAAWAGSDPSPLEAGERGVYGPGAAVVLDGPQVLVLRAAPSPEADRKLTRKAERLKNQGKDVSKLYEAFQDEARLLAPVVAAAMGGACSSEVVLALPAAGVDPCLLDPAVVEGDPSLTGLVGTNSLSASPPWLECTYRNVDSGPIEVSTLTAAQLAASIGGLTGSSVLRDVPKSTRGTWQTVTEGPLSAAVQTAPGFEGPGVDALILVPGADPTAENLLRIRQISTGTLMDPGACGPIVGALVGGFVAAVTPSPPAETDAFIDQLVTNCTDVTSAS